METSPGLGIYWRWVVCSTMSVMGVIGGGEEKAAQV